MDLTACKYSILKYVPDPSIGEVFNVGVIMHCPDPFYFRVLVNSSRVKKAYKSVDLFDLKFITSYLEKLTTTARPELRDEFLKISYKDTNILDKLAERYQDSIIISEPSTTVTLDPENELQRLMTRYVQTWPQEPKRRFSSKVLGRFKEAGIDDKISTGIQVDVDIVDRVQFGYQNGRPNLIQPIPLNSGTQTNLEKAAFWNLAIHEIRTKSEQYRESPFYAIVQPSHDPQKDGFDLAMDLLQQNFRDDEMNLLHVINFESPAMERFIHKIREEAHSLN